MKNLVVAFVFALGSLSCLAGTRDPNVPDEEYLAHGENFGTVVPIKVLMSEREVMLDGKKEKEMLFASASCVVIRPNWAVTAGHVVFASKATSIKVGDKYFIIDKTIVHEKYDDDIIGINDIALCYSKEDFRMERYSEIYTDQDELGKKVDIAGYGWEGDFIKGMSRCDGRRRAGSNKIDATSCDLLFCTPSVKDSTPLEFLITPGDSGGGLFIDGRLAGINSFLRSTQAEDLGKSLKGRYGQEAAFVRISRFADWIEGHISRYSNDSGVHASVK